MRSAAEERCQFVISTHSVVLMACPEARVLSFDAHPAAPIAFDDLEQVRLARDFLNRPEAFLRHL